MIRSRHLALALSLLLAASAGASAASDNIHIDAVKVFPESMTSTPNHTVYTGSIGAVGAGRIFRALPGQETAEPWIGVGTNHMLAPFGVLADAKSNTLWVCSNDAPGGSYHGDAGEARSALLAFDLKTGKGKGYYPFPVGATPTSLCNDIAIGPDGSAYATDTRGDRILRLKKGASALELWFHKDDVKGGFDGIVFGGPKLIYIDMISASKLARIKINDDGSAGDYAEIKTDKPIKGPDGFRPAGGNRYILGQGGELDLITITGDNATIDAVLKTGMMAAIGGSVSGDTVYILDGRTPYRISPQYRDQDPGDFRVYKMALPKK